MSEPVLRFSMTSIAKTKLVEQLTLVTLQTAHHGSTSPRIRVNVTESRFAACLN